MWRIMWSVVIFSALSVCISPAYAYATYEVTGWIDGIRGTDQSSLSIAGWACQKSLSASISVQLYVGGYYGAGGTSVSGVIANEPPTDLGDASAINSECGTSGIPHRFHIPITQDILRQYYGRSIYVYGISQVMGVYNNTLSGSGTYLIPTPNVIGTIDGIKLSSDGALAITGWACQRYMAVSIPVQLYVGGYYGEGGISVTGVTANDTSDRTIDLMCGTTGIAHRFHVPLTPDLRRRYPSMGMYVYGISQVSEIHNMTLDKSGAFLMPRGSVFGFNYFPASGADPSGCYGNPNLQQPSWSDVSREVAADLILMKSLDVTTVRLPLLPSVGTGWSRSWVAQPASIQSYCNHLVDMLTLFKRYGFKVVVDLHNFYWNPWDSEAAWFKVYDKDDVYRRLFETDMRAFCAVAPTPSAASYQNYAKTQYGVSGSAVAGASCASLSFSTMEADAGFQTPKNMQKNNWRFYLKEALTWAGTLVDMIEGSSAADAVLYYDLLNEFVTNDTWVVDSGFDYDESIGATPESYIQEMYKLLRNKGIGDNRLGVSVVGGEGTTTVSGAALDAIGQVSLNGVSGSIGFLDIHYYPESTPWDYPNTKTKGTITVDLATIHSYVASRWPTTTMVVAEMGRETHASDAYWSEDKQEAMILDTLLKGMNQTPQIPFFLNWGLWGNRNAFAFGDTPHQPKRALAGVAALGNLIPNADAEIAQNGVPPGWNVGGNVPVTLRSGSTGSTPTAPAATHERFAHAVLAQACGSGCWIWVQTPTVQVDGPKKLYINAYVRSNMTAIGLDIVQYDANWQRLPDLYSPQFTPPDASSWNNYLMRTAEQNPSIGAADSSYGWTALTDSRAKYLRVMIIGQGKSDGSSTFMDVDAVSAAAETVP